MVSLEGVLVATFVLTTQNRMSRDAERRTHLNLPADLPAEQELTMRLRIVRSIAERLDVEVPQTTNGPKR